jgi:hypothetical protein
MNEPQEPLTDDRAALVRGALEDLRTIAGRPKPHREWKTAAELEELERMEQARRHARPPPHEL